MTLQLLYKDAAEWCSFDATLVIARRSFFFRGKEYETSISCAKLLRLLLEQDIVTSPQKIDGHPICLHVYRLRKVLRAWNLPLKIETILNDGYRLILAEDSHVQQSDPAECSENLHP